MVAEEILEGDEVDSNPVAAAAKVYFGQGVGLARIRQYQKTPTDANWTARSAEPEEFKSVDNIGVLGGWLSDGGKPGRFLVCVDLDTVDAVARADEFLPKTDAVEGRVGKPRSHRWYFVTDVPAYAESKARIATEAAKAASKAPGPFKKQFRHAVTGDVAIDFIGTGGQATVPPSFHESGEKREWFDSGGFDHALELPFIELWDAVCQLAQAVGANIPNIKSTVSSEHLADENDEGSDEKTAVPVAIYRNSKVVAVQRRDNTLPPMPERVEHFRLYLPEVDLARSGHGGHDATYRLARLITNDFAITDRVLALELMNEFNGRLRENGEEVWSPDDLEHKLDEALNNSSADPKYPFGGKLQIGRPVMAWNNPARLADEFLGMNTVKAVKDTLFYYDGRAYRIMSKEQFEGRVRQYLEAAAESEFKRIDAQWRTTNGVRVQQLEQKAKNLGLSDDSPDFIVNERMRVEEELKKAIKARPLIPPVTLGMVANAAAAIRSKCQLDDYTPLDIWLRDEVEHAVVSVANGLLDPINRSLQPHSADWFSTVTLPVRYDPQAARPEKWLKFLKEIMEGDDSRIAILQEIFGASLDRSYPAKWFAMLVGEGDNGKSVFLSVLKSILGESNCSAVNLGSLASQRFSSFGLFGKLANIVGDQGYVESGDEGWLKTLTGGDLVTYEQKGRDPFSGVNTAKLIFASNTPPTFGDKSEAVWNRLIPVPFQYTVPADKKNPALLTSSYWESELSGILNWALDGLERLRKQRKFTLSTVCEAMRVKHRSDSNPARMFLAEHLEYQGGTATDIPAGDLYNEYQKWCESQGLNKPLTAIKFAVEVDRAFPGVQKASPVTREGKSVRVRFGLKWKEEVSPTAA